MNHRQRFEALMRHEPCDKTMFDLIAQPQVTDNIVKAMNVKDFDELCVKWDIGMRHIDHKDYTSAFLPNSRSSYEELVKKGEYTDIWGITRRRVRNEFGFYDEAVSMPFVDMETLEDVEAYNWPPADIMDFSRLKEDCAKYHDDYVVVFGSPGIMDILTGTGHGRGFDRLMLDLAMEDPVIYALLDKRNDFFLEMVDRALSAAADVIDVLWLGDDYGMQTGQMMSLPMWRKVFKPRMKAYIDLAHKYGVKAMFHSCGANRPLIPDWIEMGLDIYQAVQTDAVGMEAEGLFRDFGKDIVFHGMIGQQSVLSQGTPDDVRKFVRDTIKASGGTGYICAPTHFLELDVPLENALAMYECDRTP